MCGGSWAPCRGSRASPWRSRRASPRGRSRSASRSAGGAAGIPEQAHYRSKKEIAWNLVRRAEANGHSLGRLIVPAEYLADPASAEALGQGGRSVAVWSTSGEPLMRAGAVARHVLEERM